jgi:hypothetical protein
MSNKQTDTNEPVQMSLKLMRLAEAARRLAYRKARIAVLQKTLEGINKTRAELAELRQQGVLKNFNLTELSSEALSINAPN